MIYEQVNDNIGEALAEIDNKISALAVERDAKQKERLSTDSKSREKELVEELKQLRHQENRLFRERSLLQETEFKRLLAEENGLPQDHPKFEKAYALAYQYGHSNGFSEVESHFMDLADLVR